MMRIGYLADHPELVSLLADWFYQEWGRHRPEDTLDDFTERLRDRMNRDRLPLTLVIFFGQEPFGTASLKIREMETHPQYEHWLGSVYIRGEYRGRGLGTYLVQATIQEAIRFRIEVLYLYTHGSEAFYERLDWKEIDRPIFRGRQVTLMKRLLMDRK